MASDIDTKKAYEILSRINSLVIEGNPVTNSFFYKEYNLWHTFQQSLYEDCKHFTTGQYEPRKKKVTVLLKNFLLGLLVFLETLVAILVSRLQGKRVLVYGLDKVNSKFHSDSRTTAVYEALELARTPYVEYLRTILGKETIKNFLSRGRLVIFTEASSFLIDLVSLIKPFTPKKKVNYQIFENEKERKFAEDVVLRYSLRARNFSLRVAVIKRFLKFSRVRCSLMIDDVRFWGEFILAAKDVGIKTVAVQHGHYTKYHVGWLTTNQFEGKLIVPETLFVWSDYWKKELTRLGGCVSTDNVRVGGFKSGPVAPEALNQGSQDFTNDRITVLIPYETACLKEEVKKYIDSMLQDPRISVIFKSRIDMDRGLQLSEYGLNKQYHKNFEIADKLEDVVGRVDVVAGTYSTFLYDVLIYKKPVVILKTGSDYGEGMLKNGLADEVSIELGDLYTQLSKVRNISKGVKEERMKKYFGDGRVGMSKTLAGVLEKEK